MVSCYVPTSAVCDISVVGLFPHAHTAHSPEQALFNSMIIKCVVQLELIQAIENTVFYPNTTRQEDQDILSYSQVKC